MATDNDKHFAAVFRRVCGTRDKAVTKPRSRRGGGRPTIADVAQVPASAPSPCRGRCASRSGSRKICAGRSQAAVETLGYVPDPNARALASARADVIGVLVPSLTNNVFADVVRGIYDGLSDSQLPDPDRQHALFRHGGGAAAEGVPRPAAGRADRLRHRPDAGGAPAAGERRLPGRADHGDRSRSGRHDDRLLASRRRAGRRPST